MNYINDMKARSTIIIITIAVANSCQYALLLLFDICGPGLRRLSFVQYFEFVLCSLGFVQSSNRKFVLFCTWGFV